MYKNNVHLKELFQTEISIMKKITHPNVVHLYDIFLSEKNIYLLLDYCNNKDFESWMHS